MGTLIPRPLGWGVADAYKHASLHLCYYAKIGRWSNDTSVITETRQKNMIPTRLSIPLKVIGTDTDRSPTFDFLLMIRSNHGPILYRFQDKLRFPSQTTIFSHS